MEFRKSIYLSFYEDLPAKQAVEILTDAGFVYGEISEDHLRELLQQGDPAEVGAQFGRFAKEHGISLTQGHLSFAKGDWMTSEKTVEKLKPELTLYAALGVKNAVLHANGDDTLAPEVRYARVVENVRKVAEFAGTLGITVCLENLMTTDYLRTADSMIQLIQDAGDKHLGICLDTGHLHLCNAKGWVTYSQREFIHTAGSYLQAMHVVDNDGFGDTHQMPFSARYGVDWKEVMTALRDIRYPGLFNIECVGEQIAPLHIRRIKLDYISKMCDYMFTDEFLED